MRDADLLDVVSVEYLAKSSIHPQLGIMELTQKPSWMDPIVMYLKTGEQPEDKTKAHILQLKVACYVLYEDKLYRRGYSMPLLKCEGDPQRHMWEPRLGVVPSVQSPKTRLLLANHQVDCMEYAHKCDKCQRFSPMSKAYSEKLTSMTSPWLFAIWGIDLICRLPKGRGSVQYAAMAVGYFAKLVEEKALVSITPTKIKEFVYKNIVCR